MAELHGHSTIASILGGDVLKIQIIAPLQSVVLFFSSVAQ